MSDWLIIRLLDERFASSGSRRGAAVALLKCLRKGVILPDDLDRVLTDMAVELGDEVAAQARDICRKIGLCD
jgi:hypothetical protein